MKKIIAFLLMASIMMFAGCGEKKENIGDSVLKVGETSMTSGQFQFFLDDVKSQMMGTELSTEESWETVEIEGKKAIEVAKERAYESAVQYLSIIEIGKKMGVSCTEEQIEETKGGIDASLFEQYENKDEIIDLVCEINIYMSALQEKVIAEQPVQDSEIEAYFEEHKGELGDLMRAKHILFLTQDEKTREPLSSTEIAAKKSQAEEILAKAKGGEDFDELVSEYSEDPGSHQQPDGYIFGAGEMAKEFEDCVRSLKMNEIGFAETSYGYHIIKRLDLDVSVFKNGITEILYYERFDKYLEEKKEEYKIEATKNDEAYDKIK